MLQIFKTKTFNFRFQLERMKSLVDEIQDAAENADKCVNFPIGDKLEAFIR